MLQPQGNAFGNRMGRHYMGGPKGIWAGHRPVRKQVWRPRLGQSNRDGKERGESSLLGSIMDRAWGPETVGLWEGAESRATLGFLAWDTGGILEHGT